MKFRNLLVCMVMMGNAALAQQLTPTTISNAGSSKTAGGVLLEDNLGGLIVNTITTPVIMYTQGFLQPDAGSITSLPPLNNVVLNGGVGVDNAGSTFISGGVMLEFTAGETASKTLGNGTHLLTQGILQPYPQTISLPVTGMEFAAKRISRTQVQLDWKTLQEMNNKGFYIERKHEQENAYRELAFVSTKAGTDGNSNLPLVYAHTDENSYTGNSYYRIRQEDRDGRFNYSVIRMVGNTMTAGLQVWPVPSAGYFNLRLTGSDQPAQVLILDMQGKLVKQLILKDQAAAQVTGLSAGTYIIRLTGEQGIVARAVVQ